MITKTATGFKVYTAANSKIVPDFIEDPYRDLTMAINNFTETIGEVIDFLAYWINPVNWAKEVWQGLEWLVMQPETAVFLMAGTIVGIWLVAAGLKFPKKPIFWSWVLYWLLRGFIFV